VRTIAHDWSSTPAERAASWPCDRHLSNPDDALYRAVDVDAPVAVTFRWLCQLRAAPYSYDWIDNRGRTSPRTLTAGLEKLAVGQTVMTIFELVEFEPDRHLTLLMRHGRAVFGDVAVTYGVAPRTGERSRIAVKLLVRYPRARAVAGRLFPLGDLVMMRKQLLTLKSLAERSAAATGATSSVVKPAGSPPPATQGPSARATSSSARAASSADLAPRAPATRKSSPASR
jgi:hypothetical protein